MKSLKRYALLVFILSAISCNQSSNSGKLPLDKKLNIEEEVTRMLTDYQAAVKKGGLTAEFAFLDSSFDFYWAPPGYTEALTYDSVAFVLRNAAPLFRSIDNSWEELKVIPLTENLANYSGILNSTMTDTSGKQAHFLMIETGNVIKRETGWKLCSGHTSIISMQ